MSGRTAEAAPRTVRPVPRPGPPVRRRPARGAGAVFMLPSVNTTAMNRRLAETSSQVAPGVHAVVTRDGNGWHQTGGAPSVSRPGQRRSSARSILRPKPPAGTCGDDGACRTRATMMSWWSSQARTA